MRYGTVKASVASYPIGRFGRTDYVVFGQLAVNAYTLDSHECLAECDGTDVVEWPNYDDEWL